ncbi:hypothetical protein MesoLj113c_32590 [Mesorhizobium sp. 113-3-9]|uniref:hypothetical protein n=1 Tax=Mesorhizobium sp. 113-3-9 TaxID=2744517 RepID=UPI0019293360|nr:hypothetical protein [Mesorhizobium sp. 113-3-9]BCG87149.1 hypothetical protein MesoLj113c_32590 [Mesorhizobium sp. 113-3-9]
MLRQWVPVLARQRPGVEMSGSAIKSEGRFVFSVLTSASYLLAAASAYAQMIFVGLGWAYVGDVFYPNAGDIIGVVPSLAVTIMGLNSVSLAKSVLAKAGITVVEDQKRWGRFSVPRLTVYIITMLWGMCAAIFWEQGPPPAILIVFLFAGVAYVNGYALARIPNFTVAYLTDASAEQERQAANRLYGPTVAVALPAIVVVACLLATAGSSETYVEGFLSWGTFLSALIPLLYFPYFVAASYNLLELTKASADTAES